MEKVENNLKTIFEYKPFLEETEAGVFEEVWTTKDGVKIPFSQVTQQHWSNIYWYHRYIFETSKKHYEFIRWDDEIDEPVLLELTNKFLFLMGVAERELNLRFKGEILEWVPIYPNEKAWYKIQNTRKVLIEKWKSQK